MYESSLKYKKIREIQSWEFSSDFGRSEVKTFAGV